MDGRSDSGEAGTQVVVRLTGSDYGDVGNQHATGQVFAPLRSIIEASLERADLDGHLALMILVTGYHTTDSARTPWAKQISTILARDVIPPGPLRRTHDVAVVGVRLALGGETTRLSEYSSLVRHECSRQALPPAVRVHDDERLLLGLAAGAGVASHSGAEDIQAIVRPREHSASLRIACLDLWAEALAESAPKLTESTATRAYSILTEDNAGRPPLEADDIIPAYWLATRLLDAPWSPSDDELLKMDGLISDLRRAVLTRLAETDELPAIDAAFALDALIATPVQRAARQAALTRILAIVNSFPASARILYDRKRNRAPFEIADEYDLQDLFFAVSLSAIPDMVDEDPGGKLAGRSIRLDFTSQATRLGFELKYVKSVSDVDRVRREILIDEASYQKYPAIETVLVFVYDPGQNISLASRTSFEADLSKPVTINGRTIEYITRVRG